MENFYDCLTNAAECQRMADDSNDPIDKSVWTRMAEHWRYVSTGQLRRAIKRDFGTGEVRKPH